MRDYAIITGASRGIGREIALELSRTHNVILTAHKDLSGLEGTASMISGGCLTFLCDVASSGSVRSMFSELESRGINPSVLVNNAGIDAFNLVQDISDEEWHRIMGVNLDGVFYMSRAALPSMIRKKNGTIINISSYWGIRGSAMESAYCASKGGVNAFTLSLADELTFSGIHVNALACEYINTSMNSGFSPAEIRDVLEIMPSHRVIEPSEVAGMVRRILDRGETGKIYSMNDLI